MVKMMKTEKFYGTAEHYKYIPYINGVVIFRQKIYDSEKLVKEMLTIGLFENGLEIKKISSKYKKNIYINKDFIYR